MEKSLNKKAGFTLVMLWTQQWPESSSGPNVQCLSRVARGSVCKWTFSLHPTCRDTSLVITSVWGLLLITSRVAKRDLHSFKTALAFEIKDPIWVLRNEREAETVAYGVKLLKNYTGRTSL